MSLCQAKGEKRKFASTEFWADCKDRGPILLDILGVKRCAFSRHMLGKPYPHGRTSNILGRFPIYGAVFLSVPYTGKISHIRGKASHT